MDWVTAYSHLRMELAPDVRIRTLDHGRAVTFELTTEDGYAAMFSVSEYELATDQDYTLTQAGRYCARGLARLRGKRGLTSPAMWRPHRAGRAILRTPI